MQSRTFSGLGINVSLCFLHLTTKVFHLMLTVHLLLIYPFLLNIFFVFFVFDVIGVSSYLTFIIFTVV